MERLAELQEYIDEELNDACKYANMALKYKTCDSKLADSYIALAKTELQHATLWRNHVDRICSEAKIQEDHAWDWYRNKQLQTKAEIMALIGMYK